MRNQLIDDLIAQKIINCKLKSNPAAEQRLLKNINILNDLINATNYLSNKASIKERLLNIRLNICKLPKCDECSLNLEGRIYEQAKRYHRFCNEDCRHSFVTKRRTENLGVITNGVSKAQKMARGHSQRERNTFINGKSKMDLRLEKALKTRIANGNCIDPSKKSDLEKYRSAVAKVTYKQPIHNLKNIEKRGPIKLGGWQLDHRFSIVEGFLKNVPPEIIGNIVNLEVIPGLTNVTKQSKCSIILSDLIDEYNHQNPQQVFLTKSYDRLRVVS